MYILNEDFGCYYTGFFVAKLNMKLNAKMRLEIKDNNTATILHEYIHYLQDISTTRGLKSITSIAQKLQLVFSQANNSDYKFVIPIRNSQIKEINSIVAFNDEMFALEKGDINLNNLRVSHINRVCCETDNMEMLFDEYLNEDNSSAKGYQNIEIYFDDLNKPYRFGSDCIAESMAYLSERILCNSFERMNELPYNGCEMLCNHVSPNTCIPLTILVAICELSLMSSNSGKLFYDIINDIRNKNLSFEKVEEFEEEYNSLYNFLCLELNKNCEEVYECLDFLYPLNISESQSDICLVNGKMKKNIYLGIKYRNQHGLFISKAIEKREPKGMEELFDILGMPLLIDKNMDLFATCQMASVLTPLAVFYSFFSELENERSCFLYDYCKKQCLSVINEGVCKKTPWNQEREEKLCPYALYIHRYAVNPDSIILHEKL